MRTRGISGSPEPAGCQRPHRVPRPIDPRGDLTSDGSRIFLHDDENRMARVTTTGGAEVVRHDDDPADRHSIKTLYGGAR